jgi:hypothetical protein
MSIFNKARSATSEDYVVLQGGAPRIEPVGKGLVNVIHSNGMIVPTREDTLKQTTIISIKGEAVEFQTALVRSLHGEPCEARSRKEGGGFYERR